MNKKGFGLTEMIAFTSILLFCLIFVVVMYHKNFDIKNNIDESNNKEEHIITSIESNDNVDSIDNYIVKSEEKKESNKFIDIEQKIINTAKIYIEDNFELKNKTIIIKTSKLIEKDYLEAIVNPNNRDEYCKGYIIYDGKSEYEAYITCGEDYETKGYNLNFE